MIPGQQVAGPGRTNDVITIWRNSLRRLIDFYDARRGPLGPFFVRLFLFFVVINVACYWLAMFTAFPELTRGSAGVQNFKIQFPVGILGATFDSLSFFVTVWIVRHALRTQKTWQYVAHLSVDLVIAVVATFWVLFVFSFSGWLIQVLEATPTDLGARTAKYHSRLVDAMIRPTDNARNIYFGVIMGISASFPTCVHVGMFLRSAGLALMERLGLRREGPAEDP